MPPDTPHPIMEDTILTFQVGNATVNVLETTCFHAYPMLMLEAAVCHDDEACHVILGTEWGTTFGECGCVWDQAAFENFVTALTQALDSWKSGGWKAAQDAARSRDDS
jgi:hypothetical protein